MEPETSMQASAISPQWRRNKFENGVTSPVWNWGHGYGAKCHKLNFCSCPSTFLALKLKFVVLVRAFVMVSTVSSVSCLLFFYSRCPPCQAIMPFVKVGARAPHSVWSRRHRTPHVGKFRWVSVWVSNNWFFVEKISTNDLSVTDAT